MSSLFGVTLTPLCVTGCDDCPACPDCPAVMPPESCCSGTHDVGDINPASQLLANVWSFSQVTPNMPVGCSFVGMAGGVEQYLCVPAITFAAFDQVVIDPLTAVRITFQGAFVATSENVLNEGGDTDLLQISTVATLTLGAGSILTANVDADAAVVIGAMASVNGNVIASGAATVTTGNYSRVTGLITTDIGAIVLANRTCVGGAVTSQSGAIALSTSTRAYSITSSLGAITTGADTQICEGITAVGITTVTLVDTVVGGGITSEEGGITATAGTIVGDSVHITGAGIATFTDSHIGGDLTTNAGNAVLVNTTVAGSILTN
jgi:hypothetical protein